MLLREITPGSRFLLVGKVNEKWEAKTASDGGRGR